MAFLIKNQLSLSPRIFWFKNALDLHSRYSLHLARFPNWNWNCRLNSSRIIAPYKLRRRHFLKRHCQLKSECARDQHKAKGLGNHSRCACCMWILRIRSACRLFCLKREVILLCSIAIEVFLLDVAYVTGTGDGSAVVVVVHLVPVVRCCARCFGAEGPLRKTTSVDILHASKRETEDTCEMNDEGEKRGFAHK